MQHFKKYADRKNTKYVGGSMQKYGTELLKMNNPISFHSGPDT